MNIFSTSTFSFLGIVKGIGKAVFDMRIIFGWMLIAAFLGLVLWYLMEIYLPKKLKGKKK